MSDGLKLLAAIVDTGSVHTLRELNREVLLEEEATLYDFLRSHYRRYGSIPSVATIEEDAGLRLPQADEDTDYYIKRVHDRHLYSLLRNSFNDLKNNMRAFDMDAVAVTIEEMRRATRIRYGVNEIKTLDEAMVDVMQEYDFSHVSPGVSGVPVNWPRYDACTGGYQPGDLVIIVARPEQGKTYNLLRQAIGSWQCGYSVLVVTMEMTIAQVARRWGGMQSGINPTYIRKGMLSTHGLARMNSYREGLVGGERLKIFSGGMKKKVSDVDMMISEYRPDIVYIDGIYLMHPDAKRSMQKTEKVSEVLDELKQLTLSQRIPVVGTTQFNRQAGKKGKDGSLENIAYTDAISTHSSLVLSLNPGPAPYQKTRRVMEFLKGREGESGRFELNFTFSPMNFDETPLPLRPGEEGYDAALARGDEVDDGGGTVEGVDLDWMG